MAKPKQEMLLGGEESPEQPTLAICQLNLLQDMLGDETAMQPVLPQLASKSTPSSPARLE
jgi:hypothetical protein